MKNRLLLSFLLCLSLVIFVQGMAGAEEISTQLNAQPVQVQVENVRYSLGAEKNRLVFDFNAPFTYQVISDGASENLTIVVSGVDVRLKKDALFFTDKALKKLELITDPLLGTTTIKIALNYRLPYQVLSLTDPNRLVVDLTKIFEERKGRSVVPGVEHTQIYSGTVNGPLQVDLLKVDLTNPNLEIKPILAQNGNSFTKQTVSQLAAGSTGVVAAINGTYFASNGTPLGLLMVDGKMISYPWGGRTALGITSDKRILIDNVGLITKIIMSDGRILNTDGVNCSRGENQLIVYTTDRGLTTKTNNAGLEVSIQNGKVLALGTGDLPIPPGGYVLSAHGNKRELIQGLAAGDNLQVEMALSTDWLNQGINHIVSGGPRLVKEGKVFITSEAERFKSDITQGRAPRSALGVTADQKLILVAVTGRQPSRSIGLTLNELAQLMIKLGAKEAMNLDGGGSTTLLVQGEIVNSPSDGQERKVSNALVINYFLEDKLAKGE